MSSIVDSHIEGIIDFAAAILMDDARMIDRLAAQMKLRIILMTPLELCELAVVLTPPGENGFSKFRQLLADRRELMESAEEWCRDIGVTP